MTTHDLRLEAVRSRAFIRAAETQLTKVVAQSERLIDASDLSWFAGHGVMQHFGGDRNGTDAEYQALVDAFDVAHLAEQLEQAGASWYLITIGQNSGYYHAPSNAYCEATGYEPGTKCASRDLIGDLIDALAPRGIKVMLYLPASPAGYDPHAEASFGFQTDQQLNPDITIGNARRWARVMREWSLRYGLDLAGWWIDGAYSWRFSDAQTQEKCLRIYNDAMKAGNPYSLVSFNDGKGEPASVRQYSAQDDYTAGETLQVSDLPGNDWSEHNTARWHVLAYLGEEYGDFKPARDAVAVGQWVKAVNAKGGVVTLDVQANRKNPNLPIGSIWPVQLEQLLTVREEVAR